MTGKLLKINSIPILFNLLSILVWMVYWIEGSELMTIVALVSFVFNTLISPFSLIIANFIYKENYNNNIKMLFIMCISQIVAIMIDFSRVYFTIGLDTMGWSFQKGQCYISLSILFLGWIFICFVKIYRKKIKRSRHNETKCSDY